MKKKYLPHLCVLASGILWGLIGLFNRRLTAAGFSDVRSDHYNGKPWITVTARK